MASRSDPPVSGARIPVRSRPEADGEVVEVAAPAKLNLSLSVIARRPDGFHAIESLMVPVSLADRLVVRRLPRPGVRLRVRFGGRLAEPDGAVLRRDVPVDDSNLVVRAVKALAEEAGVEDGIDIDLLKEIPSGAGLGGGSSDAASALAAAARVWRLGWSSARLAEIGARIGSDVPWFFTAGPAVVGGRGEVVVPTPGIPPLHAVIACPEAGLSTAAVYRACTPDAGLAGTSARMAAALARGDLAAATALAHNSLEAPARSLCPDVVRLLEAIGAAGGLRPMLTGSGSACFTLARTAAEARAVAARLGAEGWPGVFAVRVGGSADG